MKRTLLLVLALIVSFSSSFSQSWNLVGTEGFTGGIIMLSMAINAGGTPYVAFEDMATGNKATVMKYNGSSWVTVGGAGFSAGSITMLSTRSIAIDGSGTPYVVYSDNATSVPGMATVMKYNGSSWVNVGSAGFSAGTVGGSTYGAPTIAIDGAGTPYVAYNDGSLGNKATVMKYNGTSWVNVGSAGFTPDIAYSTSIAIDGSGTPYLAFEDYATGGKATVMKYDGSAWVTVGSPGFSTGVALFLSLALDGSGTPYLAYQDNPDSEKTTVMKYNGTSWAPVGSTGFSAGQIVYTSLAIDGSGTPYVSYGENRSTFYDTVKVMKYNGSSWVEAGTGVSLGAGTSIAINGSGTPYVAYGDNIYSAARITVKELSPATITGNDTLCAGVATSLSDATGGGTWTSTNTGIATVSSTGTVTGVGIGTATISYTVSGLSATVLVTVITTPSAGSITGATHVCSDSVIRLTESVTGGVWNSSTTTVATVNGTGAVAGATAGSATITYSVTNQCGTATATKTVTVNACRTAVNNTVGPVAYSLKAYPDPNQGSFALLLSSPVDEDAQIIITNAVGEKVKEMTIATNKEEEVKLPIPPGIYFISAVSKSTRVTTRILIQ